MNSIAVRNSIKLRNEIHDVNNSISKICEPIQYITAPDSNANYVDCIVEVMIYTGSEGALSNVYGHADISIEGTVYAYGRYEEKWGDRKARGRSFS